MPAVERYQSGQPSVSRQLPLWRILAPAGWIAHPADSSVFVNPPLAPPSSVLRATNLTATQNIPTSTHGETEKRESEGTAKKTFSSEV